MKSGGLAVPVHVRGMIRNASSNRVDAMRIPIAVFAAAVTLAACASRQEPTRSMEPRNAGSVRLYANSLPRCPYEELGRVSGVRAPQIRRAAFNMRANAVILEPVLAPGGVGPLSGVAIRWESATCRG
jgi:hypothetical protein